MSQKGGKEGWGEGSSLGMARITGTIKVSATPKRAKKGIASGWVSVV